MTQVTGTATRRIEVISAMLRDYHEPPSPLLDAHFMEEQLGDDVLGPADYRGFMHLQVAPENLAAWQALLVPLDRAPAYASPSQATGWWVDEDTFASLQFYEPAPLTGRTNGWIALDPATGTLYLFSFTT